ncbi:MAG TPA: TonB family protein [Sulfurovum sp.]|uniref:energy transducer TonB n=1 Tax=Sulfurovum sp. TaxID=1969726 RepID=UPI002F93AE19
MLHLLILWLFVKKWEDLKLIPPPAQDKKISLDLQQITPPPAPKPKAQPVTVPPVPQPVVTPPVTQPVVEKQDRPEPKREALKQKHVDERAKVFAEKSSEEHNLTEPVPKPEKKIAKKEVEKKEVEKKPLKKVAERPVAKKPVLQKTAAPRRPKRSGDPLANALMGSGTSMYPAKNTRRPSSSGSYGERMIHTLYGEEFNSFTETQKKYIKNNLGTIHRITQNTLTRNGYPEIAVRTRQQGVNVVSFYLHPNGDISDLKLKKHIGYAALDENTLEVIRIAYKDYPLPNKKTKIIFNVNYSLY